MNKAFLNEEGIIEVIYVGRQTFKKVTKTAGLTMVLRDKLLKEKKKLKVLADLSKITSIAPDALIAAADSMKTKHPTKSALFGGSALINGLAGILISATGKAKDIMIFETRKEAEKWLRK